MNAAAISMLNVSDIKIDESVNPRRIKSIKGYEQLKASIAYEGVLQPILVRPQVDNPKLFLVVAGHTRFQAVTELGLETIPALIRELDDSEARQAAAVENIQRQSMSPVDEGRVAKSLLLEHKNDIEEVLKILGWGKKKLDSRILITHLVDECAQALCDNSISIGHAEILAGLRPETQPAALKKILKEKLTVTDLKERIEAASLNLSNAIFDTAACLNCQYNSDLQISLFSTGMESARCRNPSCFSSKVSDKLKSIVDEQREKFSTVKLDKEVAAETYVHLTSTGSCGVGEAQFTSCQSCKSLGALVHTGFKKEGFVDSPICFDVACNKEMVASYSKLIATDAPSKVSSQQAATVGKPMGLDQPKPEVAGTPQAVVARHHLVHRQAAAAQVRSNPSIAKALAILSLLADSNIKLPKTPEGWPPTLSGASRSKALSLLAGFDESRLDKMLVELAARSIEQASKDSTKIEQQKQPSADTFGSLAVSLVKEHNIDLTQFFCLDKNYLSLLTKSAINVILTESGFKEAYEAKGTASFSKLMQFKKDELLNSVDKFGHDFRGYLPPHLAL